MLFNGSQTPPRDVRKSLAKAVDDVNLFKESYVSKGGSDQSKFRLRSHLAADARERFKNLALKQIMRTSLAMQGFMRQLTHFYVLCKRALNQVRLQSISKSKMSLTS
jgi:hypothetical protein